MEADDRTVNYTFIKEFKVNFGQGVFLSGSCPSLGQWYVSRAVPLQCKNYKYWVTQSSIPLDIMIEYKFFVAPYECRGEALNQTQIQWLGNRNERVLIQSSCLQKFQGKSQELQIMSFNLRYQNQVDKGENSWESRKNGCCEAILQELPDLLGIQEANVNMVKYIMSKIGHLYRYYGKPRDLKQDESCGIFVRKDKFFVREDGYIWINQTKTPGLKGFGAPYYRYYTFLVLEPVNQVGQEGKLLMYVNTHLDNEVELARLMGVKYIAETIETKLQEYGKNLKNVFVTGDFNTSDTDPIFNFFEVHSQPMLSLRQILPDLLSDHEETFNNFEYRTQKNEELKKNPVIIDHIFTRLRTYSPVRLAVLRKRRVSDHYPIVGYFKEKNY